MAVDWGRIKADMPMIADKLSGMLIRAIEIMEATHLEDAAWPAVVLVYKSQDLQGFQVRLAVEEKDD